MVNLQCSMKFCFMVTTLSFLPLLGCVREQDCCEALCKKSMWDSPRNCCDIILEKGNLSVQTEFANNTYSILSTAQQLWEEDNACYRYVMDKIFSFWLACEKHLTSEEMKEDSLDINRAKARIQNISTTTTTHDLIFTLTPNEVPREMNTSMKWNVSHVKLPWRLFHSLQNETDYIKVAVMVIDVGQVGLFKDPDQPGSLLDNLMVSVQVGGRQIAGLNDCVELTFSHRQLPQNTIRQCVFWDTQKGRHGGWNTSGCLAELRDRETVCCCDHLTFFTLLVTPALHNSTAQALVVISNIGCGISMVFSGLTTSLYFALRFAYKKFKSNDIAKIHVNLMSSLFLLNLVYLLNNWILSLGHTGLCKGIGGLTHYCLLCCFTWMAIEAFHLYLLTIKVTNIYMRHYMVKLCLVGWGFPVLVVTVTGSINSYGKYTIMDMANHTTISLCWINANHLAVHYVTNCSYFGLILLFNTLVLGFVAWKLFTLRSSTVEKTEKTEAWKGGLTVLGLSCLLGSTWGLAFFTYGNTSVPALYLFAILNSLQGLFIFIWFAVLHYPKKGTDLCASGTGKNGKVTTASHS